MTPSLGARKLIMAAYLYYRRSSPIMSDAQFDKLALGVAQRWEKLDPHLQWQLGGKLDIMTSGHHIKITKAGEAGALLWYKAVKGEEPHGESIENWIWDDGRQVHWESAEP
jgi:hypothetical protein